MQHILNIDIDYQYNLLIYQIWRMNQALLSKIPSNYRKLKEVEPIFSQNILQYTADKTGNRTGIGSVQESIIPKFMAITWLLFYTTQQLIKYIFFQSRNTSSYWIFSGSFMQNVMEGLNDWNYISKWKIEYSEIQNIIFWARKALIKYCNESLWRLHQSMNQCTCM